MPDSDLVRIKALAHPLRLDILKLLARRGRPVPIKEAAEVLQEPASKLHYHFQRLLEAEFIEVTDTREIHGITEKSYSVKADSLGLDLNISMLDDTDGVYALLPLMERRLQDALRRLLIDLPEMAACTEEEELPPYMGEFREVTLERKVAARVRQALLDFLGAKESALPQMSGLEQDGEDYDLIVLMVPRLEETASSDDT